VAHVCAHLIKFLLKQLQELLCRSAVQLQGLRDPQPWARPHTPGQLLLCLLLLQELGRVLQVLLLWASCTLSKTVIELLLLQVLQKCCGCL
jgi:hypothetical protein